MIQLASILCLLLLFNVVQQIRSEDDSDFFLSDYPLVTKDGFPCEIHYVNTSDNYILSVTRIPNQTANKSVLLWHTILCSSTGWLDVGPARSLGFLLAAAGYDVWLGNSRGNTYSRNHTTLNPDTDQAFWNFSHVEIGLYDISAVTDFILSQTGEKQVYLVTHSTAASAASVLLSTKAEYNDKIKLHIALAPCIFMGGMESPTFRSLAFFGPFGDFGYNIVQGGEVLRFNLPAAEKLRAYCADGTVTQPSCTEFVRVTFGYTSECNASYFSVVLGHTPAGSSRKQWLHLGQMVNTNEFCQYDYGPAENLEAYGSPLAPSFNLSKITSLTYVYSSKNDAVANYQGTEQFSKSLNSVAEEYLIADFDHIDFIYGKDAPTELYPQIIDLIANN